MQGSYSQKKKKKMSSAQENGKEFISDKNIFPDYKAAAA